MTNQYQNPKFSTPTNKSLFTAKCQIERRKMTVEQYEKYYEKPAPAYLSATIEDLAFFIDCVSEIAKEHKVLLRWDYLEYGISRDEIVKAAVEKQNFRYRPGDYLPTAMTYARDTEAYNGLKISECHGVYYITSGSLVYGIDPINKRATSDNLYQWSLLCRFASVDDAKKAIDLLA